MKIPCVRAFLFLALACGNLAAASFAGKFKGDDLVFDSHAEGTGYAGTIQLAEQSFKFTATEKDGALSGTFQSDGDSFAFDATLTGNHLDLSSGGTHYQLDRTPESPVEVKGTNPIAAKPIKGDSGGKKTVPEVKPAAPEWKNSYRSPWGGSFRFPDGWGLREDADLNALVLTPADMNPTAPELILVTSEAAEEVKAINDPTVIESIEEDVKENFPTARRAGAPVPVTCGKLSALQLTWDAQSAEGAPVRVRVFATLAGGHVLAVSMIGQKQQVEARSETLKKIVSTVSLNGAGTAAANPGTPTAAGGNSALVGTWVKFDYKAVGTSSWSKVTRAVLSADGTAVVTESSDSAHSFHNKDQGGNETGAGVAGSQGTGGARGRWSVNGSLLTVTLEDGSTDQCKYEIRPNSAGWPILRIQREGGKIEEWSKEK